MPGEIEVTDEMVAVARKAFVGRWGNLLPFDTASLDADMRAAIEAIAPLISRAAYERGQRDMREKAAGVAEGWPVEAAGDDYQTNGNGRFWDADTIYHQSRIDAAAAIRALPTGGENG